MDPMWVWELDSAGPNLRLGMKLCRNQFVSWNEMLLEVVHARPSITLELNTLLKQTLMQ